MSFESFEEKKHEILNEVKIPDLIKNNPKFISDLNNLFEVLNVSYDVNIELNLFKENNKYIIIKTIYDRTKNELGYDKLEICNGSLLFKIRGQQDFWDNLSYYSDITYETVNSVTVKRTASIKSFHNDDINYLHPYLIGSGPYYFENESVKEYYDYDGNLIDPNTLKLKK